MASYSTGDLPVATANNYPSAIGQPGVAALICPGSGTVVITVSTAAVVAQLGHGYGQPIWEATEHFLVPGVWPFTSKSLGIDAVQLRSATLNTPAVVSISGYG